MAKTKFINNLTIEIVDPIINGHFEKENFCSINYPIRKIFYLNRGDGLLTPILENLGLRGCEAPIYGRLFFKDHMKSLYQNFTIRNCYALATSYIGAFRTTNISYR